MGQPEGRRLRRQLWGVPWPEAERRLREQAGQFEQELRLLREALDQARAEEKSLATQCESLEADVQAAARKLDRLRKGLQRTQAMAPIQELVLARQIADLEAEHADRMAALQAEVDRLREEIARRRASLQQWVTSLLQSVAGRGDTEQRKS